MTWLNIILKLHSVPGRTSTTSESGSKIECKLQRAAPTVDARTAPAVGQMLEATTVCARSTISWSR
jgi:hypothetical protein